jgi:phytoene dehydrogenase-like protein
MGVMFDAIIVGAWCGESPTAMLLARHGYRVLLVDGATFSSGYHFDAFHLAAGIGVPEALGAVGARARHQLPRHSHNRIGFR